VFCDVERVGVKQPQMILTCKLCVDGEIICVIVRYASIFNLLIV
jgi:hypothetical protein